MAPELIGRIIDATCAVIAENAELLTRLDSAIGDGDHGHNMRRGFQEIAAQREQLAQLPLGQALQRAGMALVMKVGGASGPLYGSLLISMGKAAAEVPTDARGLAGIWAEGIEAVKRRGRSDVGEKTMLDVLVPAQSALHTAAADGLSPGEILVRVRSAAEDGFAATQPMQASKGRASYLGERSVGHLDPGAQSSALLIGAVCDVLEREL
jgi:phosphoenolpyruvate---glycerone phosphotransferase subunit DhaL